MNLGRASALRVVAVVALFGASIAFPQSALAVTCSPSAHCYATVRWIGAPQNEGSYLEIYSSCLNGPNNTTNFADEELWEGTDNSANLSYWVESGMSYGEINGQARGGPFWFWADNRPGGGYNEHYVGAVALNTSYETEIGHAGSNNWWVWETSSHIGTSTSNPPYSKSMETGIETTSNSYNISGQSFSLGWLDTTLSAHNNWQYGSSHSSIYDPSFPPAAAGWISQYSSVSYYSGAGCGAARQTGNVGVDTSLAPIAPEKSRATPTAPLIKATTPVPASAISSLTALSLTALSKSMAAAANDSTVKVAGVVLTTRQDANTVASGAGVNSNQAAYLVQIQGKFTALNARMPAGHSSPTGAVLTFVVDASTGLVLDSGVSDSSIDLSALGPVTPLSL
jgi:hypothetical protein